MQHVWLCVAEPAVITAVIKVTASIAGSGFQIWIHIVPDPAKLASERDSGAQEVHDQRRLVAQQAQAAKAAEAALLEERDSVAGLRSAAHAEHIQAEQLR